MFFGKVYKTRLLKRTLKTSLFFSVITRVILSIASVAVFSANALTIGQQAPDFTLKSIQGHNLNLAEQRGQIIVMNFWASWCGPCRKEMPILDSLHQNLTR